MIQIVPVSVSSCPGLSIIVLIAIVPGILVLSDVELWNLSWKPIAVA